MKKRLFRRIRERPISSLDQSGAQRMRLPNIVHAAAKRMRPQRPQVQEQHVPLSFVASPNAEALIIVPPFASLDVPSLAAHTLQARALTSGYQVDICYASMLLAATIGETAYNAISWEPPGPFVAERLFARWAFDLPPLGHNTTHMFELSHMFGPKPAQVYGCMQPYVDYAVNQEATLPKLQALEARIGPWLDTVAALVTRHPYRVIGCTTTFEQTVCSIALLQRIKQLCPDIITILGGANCEGEMAEGLLSLRTDIDYIFAGESDLTFPLFLEQVMTDSPPATRIIQGSPCEEMDTCPTPEFHAFFDQRVQYLPLSSHSTKTAYLAYETSRGCWWGEKHHCTFCGLNSEGLPSRRKSAERVIEELNLLTKAYPTRNIALTDAIMPYEYFQTLLPRMSHTLPPLNMFYEQKANLSFPHIVAIKEAGINTIQPGIEALSSPMLQRMHKGVKAWQNLLLLRYCRIAGVRVWWSLLCGMPGDDPRDYHEALRLTRLIHHLPPPVTLWHLIIDRFSPYFMSPATYGVQDIRPYPAYYDFLPAHADIPKLAYHFVAAYQSATTDQLDVIRHLGQEIYRWRDAWMQPYARRPELKIEHCPDGYILIDTRGLVGTQQQYLLTREEAGSLLLHRPYRATPMEEQALAAAWAVVVDNWFIPLPVARIDLFYTLVAEQTDSKLSPDLLEQIGRRRNPQNGREGLIQVAFDGHLAPLEHPLAPA